VVPEEGEEADVTCDIADLVNYENSKELIQMCNTQESTDTLEPIVDLSRSDSANLDSVFEIMCKSRTHRAPCALMALVPSAYEDEPYLKPHPEITDFYKFHGGLLEAWDGPALLVFCDGKSIGASLDRNGLRPARYTRMKDGTVYVRDGAASDVICERLGARCVVRNLVRAASLPCVLLRFLACCFARSHAVLCSPPHPWCALRCAQLGTRCFAPLRAASLPCVLLRSLACCFARSHAVLCLAAAPRPRLTPPSRSLRSPRSRPQVHDVGDGGHP
jgi:hypothetical protein